MALWRLFFFFNDTATTEIYTLSLHDALPIYQRRHQQRRQRQPRQACADPFACLHLIALRSSRRHRSEEHTSELQSRQYLVCRLLLEKKKTTYIPTTHYLTQLTFMTLTLLNYL